MPRLAAELARYTITTAALVGGLTGCSILSLHSAKSELAWEARREALSQIDRFTLQARVSSGGIFGIKGNLHWRQSGDGFEMRVAGPFGVGAATLTGQGRQVEVKTAKRTFVTQDAEGDIQKRLGWAFPVMHLRYWVLGVPAPSSEANVEYDRDGLLETLEQDGWELEYEEYQDVGALTLPRKFEVANDEVTIKVVIDAWSGLPAASSESARRK